MILLALRGENFMKFRRLGIENIPRRGLIGIEGANEAGKSTVGELIQFALFGKTVSTSGGSVLDLIRWDEDHCIVELDFEVDDGPVPARYRVWREIDRHGTNFARLQCLDDGNELASGVMKVQERLESLLHFNYDDFWRSFYLAEDAHPRSAEELRSFLDRIAGSDVLRQVKEEAHAEIGDLEDRFGRLQGEIKRNKLQIDKYVPNIASIPELEAARDQHGQRIEELKRDWQEGVNRVADAESQMRERERVRDRIRSLTQSPARAVSEAVPELLAHLAGEDGASAEESAADDDRDSSGGKGGSGKSGDGKGGSGKGQDRRDGGESGARRRGGKGGRGRGRQGGGKVRERAHALLGVCRAFATLSGRIEQEISGLRKRLLSDDDDALPAREEHARKQRDRASRRRSGSLGAGAFFVIVGLAIGAISLIVHLDPEGATGWNIQKPTEFIAASAVLAAMSVGLGCAFLVRARGHTSRVRKLGVELGSIQEARRRDRERLDHLEQLATADHGLDAIVGALEPWARPGLDEALESYQSALREHLGEREDVQSLISAIADDEHRRVQDQRGRVKELKKENQKYTEQDKRESSKRDRCESEIREYRKQEGRREQLDAQNSTLRDEADAIREEIDSRYLLEQLIDETVDSIRHRAGPSLGRSMRRLLPSLTDGRYTDMQVTPDFRIRLFTSEKSDFLRDNELSGGTYEGLAFGFRLVFSQAFIKAVTRSAQFLFLDEPFKSMDRKRIHKTLQVLTRLSPDVSQVFVVLPAIDSADRELFDHVFVTSVGEQELVLDVASGESGPASAPAASDAEPSAAGDSAPQTAGGSDASASQQRGWAGFFPTPVEDDDGDVSAASHS